MGSRVFQQGEEVDVQVLALSLLVITANYLYNFPSIGSHLELQVRIHAAVPIQFQASTWSKHLLGNYNTLYK
jgi:hypothetical protein